MLPRHGGGKWCASSTIGAEKAIYARRAASSSRLNLPRSPAAAPAATPPASPEDTTLTTSEQTSSSIRFNVISVSFGVSMMVGVVLEEDKIARNHSRRHNFS